MTEEEWKSLSPKEQMAIKMARPIITQLEPDPVKRNVKNYMKKYEKKRVRKGYYKSRWQITKNDPELHEKEKERQRKTYHNTPEEVLKAKRKIKYERIKERLATDPEFRENYYVNKRLRNKKFREKQKLLKKVA